MNDPNTPPQIPPVTPQARPGPPPPLGGNQDERQPVSNPVAAIEAVLRHPRRIMFQLRQPRSGGLIGAMILVAMACALIYGVVVGTFSGGTQLWTAPVKIAAGLLISALICLPSLYIFICLSGSQARLVEVVGLVGGLLMLMTVLLVGFAPVAWVFSQSTESVVAMGALHLAFWIVATWFGVRFLKAGFAQHQEDSGGGLKVWVVIFVLVMLQMTTALRPLIGEGDTFLPAEKKFFVSHWIDCLKQTNKHEANRNPAAAR